MRIKTYTAQSLNKAMQMIRDELGSEAVIVSTLEADEEVRVTAALEDDLSEQFPTSTPALEKNPELHLIYERLERHHIPEELLNKLMETCSQYNSDHTGQDLVKSLSTHFDFSPLPTFEDTSSPTILVGPPGVGKTLTIARLAYLAALQNHPVHVITTDTHKAGAIAQISSFGQALSLEVSTASSPKELINIINTTPLGTSLLIDTPGINPFQRGEVKKLGEIILATRTPPLLVLPVGGDAMEQQEIIDAFATLGANRLILTKMDFARRMGGLLEALHKSQVQIMAYGNSPLVAKPLHPLGPKELALLLLDNDPTQAHEIAV